MKRLAPLFLITPLVLAACSRPSAEHAAAPMASYGAAADATSAPSTASPVAPPAAGAPQKPVTAAPAAPNPASVPQLAYTYDYGVEAPPARIRALMAHDQADCAAAGFAACQVTGATLNAVGRDQVTAKLTFKATPAWLKGYEDRLTRGVESAGGRLVQSAVTSEDLSRQIVDTDAAVRAKTALRDRLEEMLRTRSGSLADLLAVQEKLAEVQGDLDATASELAVMRERVATSDVTIDYSSTGVLAPQGVWSPVGHAVSAIAGILAGSVAAIIYVLAFTAPWAVIVALIVWLLRKRLPKFGKKPATPPPAQ